MTDHTRTLRPVALLAVLGTVIGCAGMADVYTNTNMDFGALQNVAVMPFQNLTVEEDAAPRVRDAFMGMLLATEAVYVVPAGEVGRGIARAGMRDPTTPTSEEIKRLSGILGVQGVFTGVLREYGAVRSGSATASVVSLSLQLVEVETGTVVWSAASTQGGVTFVDRLLGGGGEAMNDVTVDVINDLLDKLF
jgi:hypothetical protein